MVLVSNFTCIHATQMSCLTVTSDVVVGTLCLLLSTVIVSRLLRSSSETLTAKTQEEEILVSVLLSQNCFPPWHLATELPY